MVSLWNTPVRLLILSMKRSQAALRSRGCLLYTSGVVVSYAAALIFNALGMTNADGSAILDFTNIASAAWAVSYTHLRSISATASVSLTCISRI